MFVRLLTATATVGLVVLTVLNILFARRNFYKEIWQISATSSSPSVELPLDIRTIHWKDDGVQRYGLEAHQFWDSVIPQGDGSVRIGSVGQKFEVSVYHQYQCLDTLRRWLFAHKCAIEDDTRGSTMIIEHTLEPCLNYLRQSLLCNGDITLEPADAFVDVHGEKLLSASGVGVSRNCRDWTRLHDFVQKNHKNHSDIM